MRIRLLFALAVLLAPHAAQGQASWSVTVLRDHDRSICQPLRAALARGLLALDPASTPPVNAQEVGFVDFGPWFFVRDQPSVRRANWEDVNYQDWGVADGVARARVDLGTDGRVDIVHRWHSFVGRFVPVTITGHDPSALSAERLTQVVLPDLLADARWIVSGLPRDDRAEPTRRSPHADLVQIGRRAVILQWDRTASRARSWLLTVEASSIDASGRFRLLCSMELRRPQ